MRLEFLPFVPTGVLFLAAAGSAIVLCFLWRGTYDAPNRRQRIVLTSMRTAVVVALLLALAGPVLTYEVDPEHSRTLAILVDTSASMSVADATDGAKRIAEAREIAARIDDACEDDFDVRFYPFDETLRPSDSLRVPAAGKATNLRQAVERVATGAARAATVVVLSDGIETGVREGPPLAAPVHAVSVGTDLRTTKNIGFGQVDFPETLDVGTKGKVRLEVVAGGPPEWLRHLADVPLALKKGIDSSTVARLDLRQGGVVPVEVEIEADTKGFHHYELVLLNRPGEATKLDNRREAIVEVNDPDFRVLYFSARLDQEFRTIRREAAEMVGVDLTSVIELSPGRYSVQGERPGDDLARGLPTDPKLLARFHALVLGGFPAASLAGETHAALGAYVEQGGGLVWLASRDGFGRGGWSDAPLAKVSPLVFGRSDLTPLPGPVPVVVAPEGVNHPLARSLAPALDAVGRTLTVEGLYRFGAPLPGTTVVLEVRGPAGVTLPALACRDAGEGRVVVLASSMWFRWRTVGGSAAAAYATLWRQVLRYAASRADERSRLTLSTDRDRYDPGDVAVVTAKVRNANFEPATGGAVGAALLSLEGKELKEIAFDPSAGEPGTFTTKIPLGGVGAIRVAAWAIDGAGGVGEREVLLRVGGAREGERVARDRDYLRHLAESTGGRLWEPGTVDDLTARLTARDRVGRTLVTRSLLHDGIWGFLVVFLLALADWIVRRRLRRI